MTQKQKIKILDCTIRDGGYLNNWHFDLKLVRELYRAHSRSGIDFVEIGFRSTEKYFDPNQYGSWKFTPEPLVSEVVKGISAGPAISLMIDFGKADIEDIPDRKNSIVSVYRVAVHKDKVLAAVEFCNDIADKGYIACIQLMGIVNYTEDDFNRVLKSLKDSKINYVYFADSYGSLLSSDIKAIVDRLAITGKKIGFHAHNNLQLAFANTLEAIKCGVDIVDGTVYGMGRGAGNLPIEILLSYIEKTSVKSIYNTLPVLDIIDRYMLDLHQDLKWGYDLSYMLSGMYEVHPYYAKTMVDYREYSIEEILRTLETVKKMKPVGFKKPILDSIIQSGFVGIPISQKDDNSDAASIPVKDLSEFGQVPYLDRHSGRDFLVLANGPTLKEEKDQVEKFIKKFDPIVIGANYLGELFVPHYHAFGNKKRFIDYIDTVDTRSNILISNIFSAEFIAKYTDREYGFIQHLPQLSSDFGISRGVIMTNCRTISILSAAVAIAMGAERIFIAGMDGYKQVDSFMKKSVHFYKESDEPGDFEILMEKHRWNERLLRQIDNYLISNNKDGLCILTPTSHKAFYKSIDNFF
jgi:4-hydroxy 2-oxovalerate aldolase